LRPDTNFFRYFNDPSGRMPIEATREPSPHQSNGTAPTAVRPEATAPRAEVPAQTR
jgi:hypothetical protein